VARTASMLKNYILKQLTYNAIICIMKFLFLAIGLTALFILVLPTDVLASRAKDKLPVGSIKPFGLPALNVTVERVQGALKDAGYYKGNVDGRFNQDTEKAILEYQSRQGLPLNPIASKELVKHILSNKKVQSLLKQLQTQRLNTMEEAREALLTEPKIRDLVFGPIENTSQTKNQRSTARCFLDPTIKCLLDGAFASAIAISKNERRDWVLSEILVTQANAGLSNDASKTIRQIVDPRLILVALRDIATAKASAGKSSEALSAATIIPDNQKSIEAIASIASIQADQGDMDGAAATSFMLLSRLGQIDAPLKQVSLASKAVILLAKAGKTALAEKELAKIKVNVNADMSSEQRRPAMRHIARILAETGKPEQALALLKDVPDVSEHTSILVSAATAFAEMGYAQQAVMTAKQIEAFRYRSIVLSQIAITQAKSGDTTGGSKTLKLAMLAAKKTTPPFAQAYAYERICLALIKVWHFGGPDNFELAVQTAELISDNKLLAHTLWWLTTERLINGDNKSAAKLEKMAEQATRQIKSPFTRVWLFSEIAIEHFLAQRVKLSWSNFQRALSIAENLDSAWGRSRALVRLASVLIKISNRAEQM
jgi:peptidoglycan hydrolase-like protein with peptidoglycan-binding domain